MASLTGKVFAVIGASQGIGLGIAEVLASRGAALLLGSRNDEKLRNATKKLRSQYPQAQIQAHTLDACDRASVRTFLQQAHKHFGHLDGCANVAGVMGANMNIQSIWEMETEEYDYVMRGNATAIFNCLAEQLRPGVLLESNDPKITSSIVNISSITALTAFPRSAPYNASKIAVVGLTKTAALEAGPRNIRVNCIAPGLTRTPMNEDWMATREKNPKSIETPLKRVGCPVDMGNAAAFLLSDDSSFVTGTTLVADAGWTV
ncbi:hypothetical protein PV08_05139 [Exophiala spinifera]|uniref:Uncharacterized protein n=1 Tax=Exophiala spinifera TaxID=91928 RepID=A0A0D2C2V9_9EURO|nr:uncharacterized protein PV08_05139 [Exophiala spinifera]KIW17944.1 hypothetical protein PV08_05139 [Exophiala spinifera]